MTSEAGVHRVYSVGLHRNWRHPELFAEIPASAGGLDVASVGAAVEQLEGLIDLLCGAVALGLSVDGVHAERNAVAPGDERFAFGRLVLEGLGEEWPATVMVSRKSLGALVGARVGAADQAGVLECRVPSGHLVDRIPGAVALGSQLRGHQVPEVTRNAGDVVAGLDSARNHLWPSTSVTALSIPTTAQR